MSGELNTCKRSLLTDGNDNKKRKLEDSPNPICTSNTEEQVSVKDEGTVREPPHSALQVREPVNQGGHSLERQKRKKCVLLLTYSGWGYLGMQRNPGAKTIEDDLLRAMHKCGLISEGDYKTPQKMLFQRAARTDKGVSAVRQVVSLKLPEGADFELINKELPDQIRVVCMKRTTKGFNAKTSCDARTYSYVLPTFAFAPSSEEPNESFRISKDILSKINDILKMFVGTHNFHNFTSKRGFADASSIRYILSFSCGEPFIKEDCEYVVLSVKGQSFMQHQIRKMIGLAIAIARDYTTTDTITRSFKSEPLDIPKAPGLGLMLEEVHYDWYNNMYGKDGVHEALEWSKDENFIQDFKEQHIISTIIKTEKEEKSMATWMVTLSGHSYSVREERPPTSVKIAAKLSENTASSASIKTETEDTVEPCESTDNSVPDKQVVPVCKEETVEICGESNITSEVQVSSELKEIKKEDYKQIVLKEKSVETCGESNITSEDQVVAKP